MLKTIASEDKNLTVETETKDGIATTTVEFYFDDMLMERPHLLAGAVGAGNISTVLDDDMGTKNKVAEATGVWLVEEDPTPCAVLTDESMTNLQERFSRVVLDYGYTMVNVFTYDEDRIAHGQSHFVISTTGEMDQECAEHATRVIFDTMEALTRDGMVFREIATV